MKKLTKKQIQMLENYEKSMDYSLRQVYGSFSYEKQRIFDEISKEMENNDGFNLKITTYSKFVFTCAYTILKNESKFLVYHTPTKRHEFEIENITA